MPALWCHFPWNSFSRGPGVLLTESRSCLDQLATITPPAVPRARLGNLKSGPVRGPSFQVPAAVPPEDHSKLCARRPAAGGGRWIGNTPSCWLNFLLWQSDSNSGSHCLRVPALSLGRWLCHVPIFKLTSWQQWRPPAPEINEKSGLVQGPSFSSSAGGPLKAARELCGHKKY